MVARPVVVLVLLAGLVGCAGDPPVPPPLTPTTAASSPTPTGSVEPVLPDAAKAPTAAGAKAFAEFYWEMASYAQATGDTSDLKRLGAITCRPCGAGVAAIDDLYAHDAVIYGGSYTPKATKSIELQSNVVAFDVRLRMQISAQRIDFPGKKRDSSVAGTVKQMRVIANYLNGAWVVAHWEEA